MATQTHSYIVPGKRVILNQLGLKPKRPNGCWATVYAMMLSWKHQQSFDVSKALEKVGPEYRKLFELDSGLSRADSARFIQRAGMKYRPMANLTIRGWFDLLKAHGLLWVAGRASDTSGLHARIVDGMHIRELARGKTVEMSIIDPAGGKQYAEPFSTFLKKYEGAFTDNPGVYYQIRHF